MLKIASSIVFLILCMMGGSFIGVAANFIKPQSAWILNTWGYGLGFLFTIVPAVLEGLLTESYSKKVRDGFTK